METNQSRLEEARRQLDVLTRRNVGPQQTEPATRGASEVRADERTAFEEYLNDTDRAQEARDHKNVLYKVCPDCYRQQAKDRETCELCGQTPERWDLPATAPPNPERCSYIAAATTYTPEELNWYVAHSSQDTAFVKHCARVLELKGLPRVVSFWERAGFDIEGH